MAQARGLFLPKKQARLRRILMPYESSSCRIAPSKNSDSRTQPDLDKHLDKHVDKQTKNQTQFSRSS